MYKIFAVILLMLLLAGCESNKMETYSPSSEASLGEQLVFPEGYRLSSFAIRNTDMTTTTIYICQSKTNEDDYRVCVPRTVGKGY